MDITRRIEELKIKILSIYFWKKLDEQCKTILRDTYTMNRNLSICQSLLLVKRMVDLIYKRTPSYSTLSNEERYRIVDKWWLEGKFHR